MKTEKKMEGNTRDREKSEKNLNPTEHKNDASLTKADQRLAN